MRPYYKRHHDDEFHDKITITTVPRYKTSELLGDEWRTSAHVVVKRKGHVLIESSYHDIDSALKHLPWLLIVYGEGSALPSNVDGDPRKAMDRVIDIEKGLCYQPGCANKATVVYRLLKEFSREGFSSNSESSLDTRRAFCDKHKTRGDCGLEDTDRNYVDITPMEDK